MFSIENYFFNLHAIPVFFIAFLMLASGLFIFSQNKKAHINFAFLLMCLSVFVWLFATGMGYLSKREDVASFWFKIDNFGVTFISVSVYYVVLSLLELNRKHKNFIIFGYSAALVLGLAILTSEFLVTGAKKFFWGYFPQWGILSVLVLLLFFGYMFVSFTKLVAYYKHASPTLKNKIRYFFIAFLAAYTGSVDYLPTFGINVYPFGYLSIAVFLTIVGYAILRHQLMDIRLAVTRTGIFVVVSALVIWVPFWIGYQTKSWALSTAAMALFATIGPIIHRLLQRKAEAVLLAKQKHYQRFLLQAARGMAREHKLQHLLNLIVHVIKRGVRPQFAAAFLFDEENKQYELKAIRGEDVYKASIADCKLKDGDHLIKSLEKNKRPISHDEIETYKAQMTNYKFNFLAHLVVPAFSDDHLLGFLVLGEKEDQTPYTEDDIDVFSIISQQAALAIDNCLYIEAAKHNQQRLFEAEKLASVGGMAAGMSHQFKNRLNAFFQIAGGLASVSEYLKNKFSDLSASDPMFKDNIDYFDKCAGDITKEARRCTTLVQGIIGFARDKASPEVQEFSLPTIIESSLYLVRVKHQCLETELPFKLINDIDPNEKLCTIKSHLNEIIFNLLDNAYESIEEMVKYRLSPEEKASYKPYVKITLSKNENSFLITVSDNGTGVKEEDKPKIFAPFFTTKSSVISGMGMGMYIIKRMVVEQMHGKMWFESEYLKGITFYVELPQSKIPLGNNIISQTEK